jgi:hypothetical protein
MHLRNRWLPHFKHGKEKLCRGFDLSAAIATGYQSLSLMCVCAYGFSFSVFVESLFSTFMRLCDE